MSLTDLGTEVSATTIAEEWLGALDTALHAGGEADLAPLIAEQAIWRDLLGLQWDFSNGVGRQQIVDRIVRLGRSAKPHGLRLRADKDNSVLEEQLGELDTVVVFFEFDTEAGNVHGHARLIETPDGWQATGLITVLDSIHGVPEAVGADRPVHKLHEAVAGRDDWLQRRLADREYTDRDPQVVVLGGGHSGLSVAARLTALGVDTLLLERHERVGDNWRKRYSSLALHDPTVVDQLPYMPYPDTWPEYPSKDKFAGFLEYYAEALEINTWTSSQVTKAEFDAPNQRWNLTIRRGDEERVLHPRHFVIATGLNGIPRVPDFPGADTFTGTLVHSEHYRGGTQWKGKKVVVVGSAVSGHDIAQDLWEQGAEVTLVQRSSTYIVSMDTFQKAFWAGYLSGVHSNVEDVDLAGAGIPFSLLVPLLSPVTVAMAETDRELIDGLHRAGFATNMGPTGGGAPELHYFAHDGYYYNVGASDLIIDGRIGLASGSGVKEITEDAVVLENGTRLPAELIVLATGYGTIREAAAAHFGERFVENVPAVYEVGDDGELSGVWRRSGQDGLWFMTGIIQEARFYSKRLALQIAAIENGKMPYSNT